jgi:drug/metabolite transporter (DMT)-like permease
MGILYMLLASGCFATMSAFIKAVGRSLPQPELVFLRCLLALPVLFIIVRASLGQLCMTVAYQYDRAPAVASASYTSVIPAVIYGYLFWGEVPHPLTWLGGGLIVFRRILLLKSRMRVNEPPAPMLT